MNGLSPRALQPTRTQSGFSPRTLQGQGSQNALLDEADSYSTLEVEQHIVRVQAVARGRRTRQQQNKSRSEAQKQLLLKAQQSSQGQRHMFKEVKEVLGISKDVYNSSAVLRQAHAYLEMHQIPQLFDSLLARAVLERPENLREFLVETLTEMRRSKGRPTMGVFSEEDLETMFNMWDELETGVIPVSKVADTLKALNCSPGNELQAVENKVGTNCEGVDKETFMKIVKSELEAIFSSPAFYA